MVPNGEDFGLALGDFDFYSNLTNRTQYPIKNILSSKEVTKPENSYSNQQYSHPWGIFFTVLGTVLLDFDADSCQSPARAYLLDVSIPRKLKFFFFLEKKLLARKILMQRCEKSKFCD